MRLLRRAFDRMMDARVGPIPDAGLDRAARIELVRRHGGFSQAYSTAVQDGLRHFGDADGYIAYGVRMGTVVALGDPVAAKEDRARLIGDFVAAAGRPCFAEISQETATILAGMGYRIARLGFDTALDLASYDFSGREKERIRHAAHWLQRHGYSIVEPDELPDPHGALAALSARWRDTRPVHRREMTFMNRPFSTAPDPLTRRFVLVSPQGEAVALIWFDPVFEEGEVTGYVAVFKRRLPEAPSHAEYGIMKRAVDLFRQEGRSTVFLSLAPLADPGPSGFPESAPFRWTAEKLFCSKTVNKRIFNIQGHAEQRRRFHGRKVSRYFAWGCGSPFLHFVSLLRLCKAV